jgi:hypothetical protein
MYGLSSRKVFALVAVIGLPLSAELVSAHGGHMEKIPEGSYMSEDPMVHCS